MRKVYYVKKIAQRTLYIGSIKSVEVPITPSSLLHVFI